ncbi:MAG: purine-binding chemotaxis protein CheW [Petroclostridium sp.]|jgi:purine-binding chemotaxis protein CheW|uniref:chemotaxis protein CheW n=1 Tax=Petroclostridium xylanilyticum TaxID=1792311 RepID=UPI001FA8520C|nr:chemotaxis protein CheW [Petroclostridium xylanilyticum]MBZ4645884.1 CheW protein [Clostridia bacterium]MDK2809316.1 purine-binding chemotaxis protein CheW [Petroclostridium sp.]
MDIKENNKVDTSDLKQYVVFKLDKEEYALDIQRVVEIVTPTAITRVPKAPNYIKGVINLRGEIIPVMGLRERFNLPPIEETEDTRIIIFKVDDASIGGFVDSVAEVIYLSNDQIESLSNFNYDYSLDFVYGVGKVNQRIITLLNIDKLVHNAKMER